MITWASVPLMGQGRHAFHLQLLTLFWGPSVSAEPQWVVGGLSSLSKARGKRLSASSHAPLPFAPPPPLRFPRDDHIGALLAMRGDASRDMKQTIIETLEQGPTQANPNYVPIFKEIIVPSLNVAKLLK